MSDDQLNVLLLGFYFIVAVGIVVYFIAAFSGLVEVR